MSMHGRLAVGLLTLLLATVAIVVPGAGGAGADENEPAPERTYDAYEPIPRGDVAARATGEGVDATEAERRFHVERVAFLVEREAAARWPETFAGLWIDHVDYGVVVAFTDSAERNVDDLRTTFPYPEDLRAATLPTSLAALTALLDLAATERTALQQRRPVDGVGAAMRATNGAYDIDIDLASNRVVARVARPSSALAAEFAGRYGPVVKVTGGKARARTCRQTDCRYAMLGGLRLTLAHAGTCTSAFTAYRGTDRYVLSAGHCFTGTGVSARDNGGEQYGATEAYKVAYETDAERVLRTSGGAPWRESSKVFVQGETYPRLVTSVTAYTSMVVGAYLGKTGATTGTTRGYITSKTTSLGYVPNSRNFVSADMCSDAGDSGGAVWSGSSAYGILSGGPSGQCRNVNGTVVTPVSSSAGPTVFGALSYATAALGVTILTNVNLAPVATYTTTCTVFLSCTFDGGASSDDDGGVTGWTWNFGDGTTGSGKVISHTYALPGYYTVTSTVKDNNGRTATKSTETLVTAES